MYKISVIVPMYNSENYIFQCLSSLVEQTYNNVEIIVVDDGSTDNSKTIVEKMAKKHNNIKYLYKMNGGVSSARNFGLKNATGEFIGFVDSDDFVEKSMFEKMINRALIDNSDLVVCNYFENDKSYLSDNTFDRYNTILNIIDGNEFKGFTPNKLYRRKIINENNIMFNENIKMCEDLLFNIDYCQFITISSYISEKLYHYIIRESSHSQIFNEGRLTVLDSYNIILNKAYVIDNPLIFKKVVNRKIRHIMSLYIKVIKSKKLDKDKKKDYINRLKEEWINNTFLESNDYSLMEKIMFLIIQLIIKEGEVKE